MRQIKLIKSKKLKRLENKVNNFLKSFNSEGFVIVDIKFSLTQNYKSAIIIYKKE